MRRQILLKLTVLLAFFVCVHDLFAQVRSEGTTTERTATWRGNGVLDTAGRLGHRAVDVTTSTLDKVSDKIAEEAGPAAKKAAAKSRSAWEKTKAWTSEKVQDLRQWWRSTDASQPATATDARRW